ncbi:MAG: hypothetical protein LWW85_08880, partial [Marinilabiliales bacterium]|nr:hypothetical protein [Marinilabiliales bacterium]
MLSLLIALSQLVQGQTTTTFTLTLSGTTNWSAASWAKSGGTTNATYPGQTGYTGENAGDVHIVVINTNNTNTRTLTYNIATSQHISDVTINSSPGTVNLSIGANVITINGNLSGGGTLTCGSGTINLAGSNNHTGTFTYGTGTFNYIGTNAQNVRGTTYYNLTMSNGGIKTLQGNTTVVSNLTVQTGATLDFNTYTANRSAGGGTLTVAGTILLGGTSGGQTGSNFPSNFNALTMTGGTVNYDNATGGQTIYSTPSYNVLTLGNTSGTQTAGGTLTVATLNNTNSGSILNMGTNVLTVTNVNNSGTIRTQNTSATPLSTGKTWGGTVEYYAAGNQTVSSGTYNNLTLSTSGVKTVTGATVNGVLSREGTTTTTGSAPSFGANATLQYMGSTAQTTGVEFPATFSGSGGLIINNSSGVTLSVSPTLNGPLTLSSGTLNLNGKILTLGTNSSYACGGGSINGNAGSQFIINGTTATNLPSGTYQDLTINRSGGVSLCGNTTINGNLTLTAGTFAVGGNSLTLNGPAILGVPGNLNTISTSSLLFGGSSAGVSIPSSVSTLLGLTINNASDVTLNSPISINGTLTLTNGSLLSTSTNYVTVLNTAVGSVTTAGGYVDGPLARTLLANVGSDGTTYSFPVGDGANYNPIDLVNIRTGATTPVIRVTESSTGASSTDGPTLSSVDPRNWFLETLSGNFTSTYVRLTDTGIDATMSVGQSNAQSGQYSSAGVTAYTATTITSGQAVSSNKYFAIGTSTVKTYYSYQSGDWASSSTWTRDPSGSFWVNAGVPTSQDNAVILNGRTVTVNSNSKSTASLEIRLGGTLDLQTYNGHNFGVVSGQGVMKLSSGSFPSGTFTDFVAADGGTVEYYNLNNAGISSTQLTYNNLIVSNYTTNAYNVYLNNASNNITYTLNGNFDLKTFSSGSLTFSFGNSTASDNLINMIVNGNFTVAANCNVRVNNFASSHTIPDPA